MSDDPPSSIQERIVHQNINDCSGTSPASGSQSEQPSQPPPPPHSPYCPFCTIITNFLSVDPTDDPSNANPAWNPEKLSPPAYVLLSTEHVVAFMDIAPLTRGHVLVSPRGHWMKVGDLPREEMAEIGRLLPLIARAVLKAVLPDIPHHEVDYNVIQNNGPGAAQVVPHVHFHIVPRPPLNYRPISTPAPIQSKSRKRSTGGVKYPVSKLPTGLQRSYIQFGRGARHELDDDDATQLVQQIRMNIREEWLKTFCATDTGAGGDRDADNKRRTTKEKL